MDNINEVITRPKKDIFSKVLTVLNGIASFWIFVLMLVVTFDVGCRILFNVPMQGTPEIVSNSIVAIAFLQIPYVLMINSHVRATVILDKLALPRQAILQLLACIMGVALFSLVVVSGWQLLMTAIEVGEFEGEGALRVPTAPVRFIILVGAVLMIGEFIRQGYNSAKVIFARKER